MGKIANDFAKKYNLKDVSDFKKAVEEINAHYDKKIISLSSTTSPIIDFSKKTKTTTNSNDAELIYPVSEKLDSTFTINYLLPEFSNHPQIAGLINAIISTRKSHLIVTTSLDESTRIEQKEQTFLPNVLQNAWMKYIMNINRSIQNANVINEAERTAELKALDFLKA